MVFEVLVDGIDHELSWADLELGCRKVIGTLNKAGSKKDSSSKSVVLIFLPHGPTLYPAFLGSMLGGFVPSFMPCPSPRQDANLYWQSHQKLLEIIKPTAIITTQSMIDQMNAAELDLHGAAIVLDHEIQNHSDESAEFVAQRGDSIALLQHSSGTTGLKKGVALSFDAIHLHAESYAKSLELNDDDVIVSWLPLYHDMGLIACLVTPSYHAIKTVQMSAFEWINRPNILFKEIEKHNGTLCWLPNFAFEHLTNTLSRHAGKFDLSSMRAFISCSEPCKAATFERFATVFAESQVSAGMLKCCYAMAEVVFGVSQVAMSEMQVTLNVDGRYLNVGDRVAESNDPVHSVSMIDCGHVLDKVSVDIVDANRQPLGEGTIGEIAIRSDYLFTGYNKDTERTAKQLSEGIYYSNDLGFLLDDRLYVLGRKDDLIIINGRNLFAHEIEAMASQVEGVKAGRVVALPYTDEKVGSDVLVLMAERDSSVTISDEQVVNAVITRIQSELDVVPRAVQLADPGTLIKTSSGKMSRKENLRRYVDSLQNDFKMAS